MLKVSKEELKQLIGKAKEGMKNAYTPRSNFSVGAAVLTDKGSVYQGCNVESVISGIGTCAERCAIDNAIANGEYCFKAVSIITKSESPVKPCGMCLHYINEFAQVANHDIAIIMAGSNGKIKKSSVFKMLPGAFGPRDLELNLKKYEC